MTAANFFEGPPVGSKVEEKKPDEKTILEKSVESASSLRDLRTPSTKLETLKELLLDLLNALFWHSQEKKDPGYQVRIWFHSHGTMCPLRLRTASKLERGGKTEGRIEVFWDTTSRKDEAKKPKPVLPFCLPKITFSEGWPMRTLLHESTIRGNTELGKAFVHNILQEAQDYHLEELEMLSENIDFDFWNNIGSFLQICEPKKHKFTVWKRVTCMS